LFGFLASLWTRRVLGDEVEVVWLTFIFTWITFYTCEFTFFNTSGILGVICLGLFWSALGKVNIRPEIEHAVHIVWSFVQYATDTLIFLLCGIIIGTIVITEVMIYPDDWAKIVVFYFLMIVARGIMILTFYPLLRGKNEFNRKCLGTPFPRLKSS
jgi:NhaP-type Na+/H+ or K+/H+ antiporter